MWGWGGWGRGNRRTGRSSSGIYANGDSVFVFVDRQFEYSTHADQANAHTRTSTITFNRI